ncbi:UNVERIFIED_CONTAM: hypothetical protein Slati_3770700 [Sesamum latifolium]|uniref:Uncharacterized protein n=1 Tax=Sesamum latifolium TaxID=2727402 RepID=A0AAW2U676_9LAMI
MGYGIQKSMKFQCLLSDSALKYYYHEYRTCASQFLDVGYPPLTAPTDNLDIYAGLADAPKPDEEMPNELPKNLLHVLREGEALVNSEDQMVEDVVPLKVVLLLEMMKLLPCCR